jgi:hypothetical protein
MRKRSMLFSILVAVAAWGLPDGASAAEPDPNPCGKLDLSSRDDQAARNANWKYHINVTVTGLDSVTVEHATTEPNADPEFVECGDHLFEGRKIKVIVSHPANYKATIELDGTEGTLVPVYNGTEGLKAGDRPTKVEKIFRGRKAGQTVKLVITLTDTAGKTEIIERTYDVTAVYVAAIRFGFAGLVSPWEQEYSTRAAADPANNPGRVITSEAGASSPLFHTELVTSVSAFFTPVYEGEMTVTGGVMFGLGILATGTETGFEALTSVHAGLELDVGRDFAIAAVVALRRTEVLKDGYFVGRAIAENEGYTRFGVRPSFGLMLTWSPAFSKAFGKVRGVR